jgi:peptidoglycan/LPS O-acetylase OafA/YrhL
VLSGVLIATWSLKRWGNLKQIDRRQFYTMRFTRIVPCLVGLLVILTVCDRAGVPRFVVNPQHTSIWRALVAALTFHVNWLEASTGYLPGAWDILWSLSVEEVFYIVFPLLCTLLRKQVLIFGVLLSFVAIGPYARVHTQNELWTDYGYLQCMDGIALGCLAAMVVPMLAARIRLSNVRLNNAVNFIMQGCGAALCLLITVFRGTAARIGFYKLGLDVTVLAMGTALLAIAQQLRFDQRTAGAAGEADADIGRRSGPRSAETIRKMLWVATAWLRWFGRNSYEVYLTHMLVVWPMVGLFFYYHHRINAAPLWFLATTALTGIAGYAVARFYSEPVNHRLRKALL